jgi:hypothetical protein
MHNLVAALAVKVSSFSCSFAGMRSHGFSPPRHKVQIGGLALPEIQPA